jgi:hypothetical protein
VPSGKVLWLWGKNDAGAQSDISASQDLVDSGTPA